MSTLAELALAALARSSDPLSPPADPLALGRSDQADGLRRLFQTQRQQVLPVVANVHTPHAAVLLERLSLALAELGARVLVVDAADNAPHPHEMVDIDLAAAIEPLGAGVSYLAARGLPRRHVNTRGSSQAWLNTLEQASPGTDVILLHAQASDLSRMLGEREVCPVLVCGLDSASLTDAYAAMKVLSTRLGLRAFDLLVAGTERQRAAQRMAERLASCADNFLGAVLRARVPVNCHESPDEPVSLALSRLAADQLMGPAGAAEMAPSFGVGRASSPAALLS